MYVKFNSTAVDLTTGAEYIYTWAISRIGALSKQARESDTQAQPHPRGQDRMLSRRVRETETAERSVLLSSLYLFDPRARGLEQSCRAEISSLSVPHIDRTYRNKNRRFCPQCRRLNDEGIDRAFLP
jgi:hypothetical protein